MINVLTGKGQKYVKCLCENNVDLTSFGCVSGINPQTGIWDKSQECKYCYAFYTRTKSFKFKNSINWNSWKKARIRSKILRIGKMSEPGRSEDRPTLLKVLNACQEIGFRPILITKLLTFDIEISSLIRQLNGTIHFSLGEDSLEPGIVDYYGMTTEKRIEEAEKYLDDGCNIQLRLVCDVTSNRKFPITAIPDNHWIITPIRFLTKKQAISFPPYKCWENLLESKQYEYKKHALRPTYIHDCFDRFSKFCGTVGKKEHCAKCGLF